VRLAEFEAMKTWHQRHWRDQPVEKHVWDIVLTLWLAGWVGIPPAFLIHARWVELGCVALLFLPGANVALRRRLHRSGVLRCDWSAALGRPARH
jgi:hypothetical protein